MINSKSMKAILDKMHDTLDAMDSVSADEDAEDLCAEIEDLLFFIESIDMNEADASEELEDSLRQLVEMLEDFPSEDDLAVHIQKMNGLAAMALNSVQ